MVLHKKCRSSVGMISGKYKLHSPSLRLTERGVLPGPIELVKSDDTSELFCKKCSKSVSADEIVCECSFCAEEFPPEDVRVFENIGLICDNCLAFLKGKRRETPNSKAKNLAEYYSPSFWEERGGGTPLIKLLLKI